MRQLAVAFPYPFDLAFMRRALLAGLVVGVFAPMIGVFVVQRRMSLIGDGIGHLAFAGVGAGLLAGVAPIGAALAAAVAGAVAIERLRVRARTTGDLALAWVFYTGIAAGVVLVGLAGSLDADLFSYLFGQVLLVSPSEMWTVVALGALVAGTLLTLRGPLFAVVTDEEWARVAGLPVDALNVLLAVLTAVAVVAAMSVVGILLVAAMMVLPVACSQQVARSFRGTLAWSVAIGTGAVVVGLALARWWGLAAGATIVLVTSAAFLAVSLRSRRRAPTRGSEAAAGRGDGGVLGDSHYD